MIITFRSISNSLSFRMASPDENMVSTFMLTFFALFPGVDFANQRIHSLHQNTASFKRGMNNFVNQHQDEIPVLNAVAAFFNRMTDNEWFYFIPFKILTTEEDISLINYLTALTIPGKQFEELQQLTGDMFGFVLKNYDILAFGAERKTIGERDKANRVCRFCNNTRSPLTFNNKAHAISEALGNKTLVLLEECDGCNDFFSKTLEPDLVEYLSLFRTMYDIKGKGGNKNFIGKNFELRKTDKLTLKFESEEKNTGPDLPMSIPLHSHHDIALQNIYKTLCKYFLSVIPAQHLTQFQKTVQWINGSIEIKELPRIANIMLFDKLSVQPEIVVYLRKSVDKTLPFAIGEFHFTLFRYIFIIPATEMDELLYLTDDEYNAFWEKFKHFKELPGWKFENFSDDVKKPFSTKIKFDFSNMKQP